jgi:6,7-dimethyl-8-ribityllumazine synthase
VAPELDEVLPEAVALEVDEVAAVEEAPEAGVIVAEEQDEDLTPVSTAAEHAPGVLAVPPGVAVLEGGPHGFRRNVAVVVSRFNGDVTTGLLESALSALRDCNVQDDAITIVPVPGAFELPLTALALAKTRRFSCVVALGCIIRGETPHFDLIASEAASGLQLAAIETGIPVAFGVITTETREQAEARVDRGAEAARTALEMADLFSHVRTQAAAP